MGGECFHRCPLEIEGQGKGGILRVRGCYEDLPLLWLWGRKKREEDVGSSRVSWRSVRTY